MPVVASVNYVAKRIYLSADTMDADLDTLDVYREVRALRRTTAAHQKFKPLIEAGGNIEKIAGQKYTPAYTRLINGGLIVPYNASHKVRLVRDCFTSNGSAGRDCFDRNPLDANVVVDIDVDIQEVEIRQIAVSGNEYSLEQISTSVWSKIIEAGYTGAEVMRLHSAILLGLASGANTDTEEFKSLDGNKTRVTFLVDSSGNRLATTYDAT